MALLGKIIDLGNGQFGFEYITTDYNKPEQIRQVWPITALRTSGMSYCRNDEAIGKPASLTEGHVSCYLGNGNYVSGVLPERGATKSIALDITPIAPPKCRVETRWYDGRWQKLMKKGWVNV
jgi:hypothetical protein